MAEANLFIAPNYRISDWEQLSFEREEDWETALAIFENRMEGRYLSVLDEVAKIRNSGFVLVAMDCALVETLQQFREGETRDRPPSRKMFIRALRAKPFADYFENEEAADRFYRHFRCGLLHRAQTGPRTRITTDGAAVAVVGSELVVNRDGFHRLVREAYRDYIGDLRDPSNVELRQNFRTKMNHVSNSRASLQVE